MGIDRLLIESNLRRLAQTHGHTRTGRERRRYGEEGQDVNGRRRGPPVQGPGMPASMCSGLMTVVAVGALVSSALGGCYIGFHGWSLQ